MEKYFQIFVGQVIMEGSSVIALQESIETCLEEYSSLPSRRQREDPDCRKRIAFLDSESSPAGTRGTSKSKSLACRLLWLWWSLLKLKLISLSFKSDRSTTGIQAENREYAKIFKRWVFRLQTVFSVPWRCYVTTSKQAKHTSGGAIYVPSSSQEWPHKTIHGSGQRV